MGRRPGGRPTRLSRPGSPERTRAAAYRRTVESHEGFATSDECRAVTGAKPKYLQERSRRREESRQRVEAVALQLFTERGFADVTVEEVCAEAGIATATFYRYFGSKEDVFFGYEALFLEQVVRCADQVDVTDPPRRQVLCFVGAFAEFLENQRESLYQRDRLVRDAPTLWARTLANQRQWEVALAAALASRRGHERPTDDDELDASLCLVVLRGAMRVWRTDPGAPLASTAAVVLGHLRDRMAKG